MPHGRSARPLQWCNYIEAPLLTRCLHLAEAVQTYRTGRFLPRRVCSNVVDQQELRIMVLWFSVMKPLAENNKYGNVSHILPISTIMERFGPHLYLIDQTTYEKHTSTRVMLTRNNYDDKLEKVSFGNYGSPLKRNPHNGLWYHSTSCVRGSYESHAHELELGVEVEEEDLSWVYQQCSVLPSDHSLANTAMSEETERGAYCHHYNQYRRPCPSPYSAAATRRVLLSKCPRLAQGEKEALDLVERVVQTTNKIDEKTLDNGQKKDRRVNKKKVNKSEMVEIN